MDTGTAFVLVACTAACLWLYRASASLATRASPRSWLHAVCSVAALALLSVSALSGEYVVRSVAGSDYKEPTQQLQSAYAAGNPSTAAAAYTAGVGQGSFARNRGAALGIAISALIAAVAGFFGGRKPVSGAGATTARCISRGNAA